MEEEVKKLKTIISDMENNFKKILTEKDYEFINDIKSLEKKYNEVYDDQNNKFSESKKEVERLKQALNDCKDLLKNSLINEEKNEKKLNTYEKEMENIKLGRERSVKISEISLEEYRQKIKLLELEVRDQNEIILKNEALMKNYKKSLNSKDDENNSIFEESSKLKNSLSIMQINVIFIHILD